MLITEEYVFCGSLLILKPSLAKKPSKYMRDAIYFFVITKRTK